MGSLEEELKDPESGKDKSAQLLSLVRPVHTVSPAAFKMPVGLPPGCVQSLCGRQALVGGLSPAPGGPEARRREVGALTVLAAWAWQARTERQRVPWQVPRVDRAQVELARVLLVLTEVSCGRLLKVSGQGPGGAPAVPSLPARGLLHL